MREDMISAIRTYLRKKGCSIVAADKVAQHIYKHTPDNCIKEMRDYWIAQL